VDRWTERKIERGVIRRVEMKVLAGGLLLDLKFKKRRSSAKAKVDKQGKQTYNENIPLALSKTVVANASSTDDPVKPGG
jgi:hypothetical protein